MQLQQLEYFVKVAELGSLNKAAEIFYVTQPALSKSILNLEEDVGTELLHRTNKGVSLTDDGKMIFEYAKTILAQVELIKDIKIKDSTQILTVASYPLLSMSRMIAEFYNRKQDGNVVIRLNEERLMHVIDHVNEGKAEVGFLLINNSQLREVKNTLSHKGLSMAILGHDTWYANIGEHNPLFDKKEINMKELIKYPIVRLHDDHYSNLTNYLRIDGIPLINSLKQIYVSDNAGLVNVIRHTDAYRYGPGLSNRDFADFGIRSIPIHNCDVDVVVAWIKKKSVVLSTIAEEFVRFLEEWTREVLMTES